MRPALALATRYRERFLAELGATQCARLWEMVYAPGGPGSYAPLVEKAATILLQLLAGAKRVNSRWQQLAISPACGSAWGANRWWTTYGVCQATRWNGASGPLACRSIEAWTDIEAPLV